MSIWTSNSVLLILLLTRTKRTGFEPTLIRGIGVGMMEGDTFSGLDNGTQADNKVLQAFKKSFVQVQSILDQNRLLINEINQNHESKIPDNLSRNVGLIRELNNNIRRVVDLYADLSFSFTKSMEASSEGESDGKPGHKRNRPG
uniref:Protein ELF4-LIKE 3 isoform X1 n=2 Tax=Elaeis guineensis var. tenera TaxID=51953 RepID=A0A6J0PQA5_ELAGV|nr:protein ELF4-LIKE 3 isoform X1 [Elaeis guineensis]